MKKNLILTLFIPALLLTGCTSTLKEPEVEVPSEPQETRIVITARMQSTPTRVSYFEEQQENDGKTQRILHQQWNVDDYVYAFYLDGSSKKWVVLKVASITEVEGERVAQLECVDGVFPSGGKLYALYCGQGGDANPDACDTYDFYYEDRVSFTQIDDYSTADIVYNADVPEDLNVPAIMSADADITSVIVDNILTVGVDLSFTNQTAIIGVGGIQVDPGVEIDRIELCGIRASAAFEVNPSGALVFDFDGSVNRTISVDLQVNDGRPLCADDQGFIHFEGTNRNPLFMAVFPSVKEEEDEILLKARVAGGDEMHQNYYTLPLGKRDIVAGKYYYIPTRTLSAPPAVCVTDPDESYNREFSSLDAAFDYVNEQSSGDVVIKLLCDNTATSLPALSGHEEGQWVQFNLNEKTLTLDGCSLEVEDEVSFWISGYDETIHQPGDGIGVIASAGGDPFLVCSAGFVLLNNVIVRYDADNQGAPIQISGGEVDIQGGRYSWDSGVLVSSGAGSYSITGGRFSMNPGVTLASGMEIGWDDDPLRWTEESDGVEDAYCPYICLPSSLIDNVAHTVDGSLRKLKVFSTDYGGQGDERMYLARNNLYRSSNQWAFESPNWISAGQASHENLFSYNELYTSLVTPGDPYDYIGPVSVSDVHYEWMNSSQWNALLNERCVWTGGGYKALPRYLKCKVQDSNDVLWRNLLVFPDEYEWPQMAGSYPESAINISNLPWDNEDQTLCAPVFTPTQANALIAAGFVFLPAAVPVEDPVTFVVTGYNGGYWSSSEGFSYVFTDSNVGYQSESSNSELSFRVAYPCKR